MLGAKLCLLLLLGTHTLAQQDAGSAEEESPNCFLAKRYKNFRRFVYNYEAETFNSVNGATDNKSGSRISCTVEVDVPQTCSFILRTTECSLSEISDVNDEGKSVYRPAAEAEAFKAEMAKNPLKIVVEKQTDVKLFPEDDEPINILNIKRGIVSALMVPDMEEKENKAMPTVHGVCSTDFTVNSREDVATDVTISRDLSACDWFTARRQDTSPLALISGMNFPLSKLISSTQTCNYKFENQKKHMTSGACTEKHIFLPFSHKNEYGISAEVRQTITLKETSKINDRVFDHNEANLKHLPMDVAEDKSATKDAAISTMQRLSGLSLTTEGEKRAELFHKLVSELRGLKADIITSTVNELMDISSSLTWQALVQCGTPECTSAILTVLRTFDTAALEVDTVVYALGLVSNPSRMMVKDLLAMAQYKQSKPIMYALSNVARRLYKAEGVTPEITAVSEFMASLVGEDCAGEKEMTFLTLRVIGNMGDAIEAADPAVKNTLLKCMRQPATTLSVQVAAIQAFRRMSVTDESRSNLQRVAQYPKGAVQKRLAAYLILIRDPEDSDIEMVKKLLTQEQNTQIKAFVSSHIYNIIKSTDLKAKLLGKKILESLQDTDVTTHSDFTTTSRNYKLSMSHESMMAGFEGNVIFDPSNQLPREVLLETTLKAFGYSVDIWELGMDGKNFEPSIEALFGQNGFFPDTVSKALYWAEDKMPPKIREVLEKWVAPLKSEGQKVPENLVKEIVRNFNKLVKELQNQETPEAMAYLRIMGAELGYIKASDLKSISQNAMMYGEMFMKMIPTQAMTKLISSTDNELFAHYIFMDNKFFLPTASGMPLKFGLSGTFAPGAKGGLQMTPGKKELVFSPSVGVEFVTQMGIYVPEFVASAVEMHTTVYHESTLNARITMEENQIKLSIPAPQGTTKFLRISNKVLISGAGKASLIPHNKGESHCDSIFSGVKYCTKTLLGGIKSNAPYFPLNGETLFALDIMPTKEVNEYTAAIAYQQLSEGKDGRQKIDSLKITLRAEGSQPTEATATMKYNRNRNVFTTKVQIPDFDVEAGVRIGMTDNSAKGKSLTIEISNKNVPQLTLIGQAKLQAMNDGLLQVQLLVPSLSTDATISATMKKTEELTIQIKSDVKLPEVTSIQAVTLKYGKDQAEVHLMSNMNADTKVPVHYNEVLQNWFQQFAEDVMDQQVVNTDMKLRHIYNKGIEAGSIWMDKITADCSYFTSLKEQLATIEIPSVPENLFMNFESALKYQFNQNRLMISVPLPLGGKSSEELRIPSVITSPQISLPQLEFELAAKKIQIPTFTIPTEYDLTLPLMGMMEMSAKVNSNFYDWEGMITTGNNTSDSPSYVAKISVMAESPIKLLSFSAEASTKLTDTAEKTIEFTVDGSLKHMLLTTGVEVLESIAITDNVLTTGRFNLHAMTPLGVDTAMTVTTQLTLDSTMLFGDLNTDASVTVGPMTATSTYRHTFSVEPAKKEAKMESTLRVVSERLTIHHKAKASYENNGYLFESNTKMQCDPIQHTTDITLKDAKLSIKSVSVTKVEKKTFQSQLEFSASEGQATLRIENLAEDSDNRAYSLLTGALNPSGLEINADASLKIFSSHASHKATLTLNTNGLTTSCTTTAQHSPVTFENTFHGGVDTTGATLSLTTKGTVDENKAEFTIEGKLASTEVYLNSMLESNLFDISSRNKVNLRLNEDGLVLSNNMVGSFKEMRTKNTNSLSLSLRSFTLQSKTENFLDNSNSYHHDISVNMERFTISANVKNELKVIGVKFVNSHTFKAEPYNVEMEGTSVGAFSEGELTHTYDIKLVDLKFTAKYNTNGKLPGSHMTHTTDVEVADFTLKFDNAINFQSPSLRLDSTLKTEAAPFTLSVDAILNSNGAVYLNGEQSGELYSKFLLKAEPKLFTQSFECRTSTSHEIKGRPTIKTNMNNKFNSLLSLQEQSVTLKVKSTVNEHTLDQEMSAYNNAEKMGVEMKAAVVTPFFSEDKQDYSISGFVKYDKSSDSHFLQIPFIEHLPAVIENVRIEVMKVMDNSIEMLRDLSTNYDVSAKFKGKVAELKDVIDNFDFKLFVEDLKRFIRSVENFITNLASKFPSDKLMNVLTSITHEVRHTIQKFNVPQKFNVIYTKMEEFLSSYEVEEMITTLMDEIVKIMKQYQIREKIQQTFNTLRSIDIQPLVQKVKGPVQELVNELYSFDFKQLVDDMSDYFTRMIQNLKSFDYDMFFGELKEKMAEMTKIPCFGKLYSEFRIISPHYNFRTTADMENTTVTSDTPEFKINLNSQAESTLKVLDFTMDASAHFAAPEMNRLSISENIKVGQSSFSLDHKAAITLFGLTAEASAETLAKATTELYTAELANKALFAMDDGVSASMQTSYNHDLNMPRLNIYTKTIVKQETVFALAAGTVTLTFDNLAYEKYDIQDFADEANHKSEMKITLDLHTSKMTFTGETGNNYFKINHNVLADLCIYRHAIFEAKFETEMPFVKSSIAEVKFQAKAEDMKIDFTATHNAKLQGQIEGTLSNSARALISPSELLFDTANKGNVKVALPFMITGKVDLQNDIAFILNSEVNQASWTGLARFNQYKYSHFFSINNVETEVNMVSQITGEGDLEMLKEPITIPEITVPFVDISIPKVEDFSIWEDSGLGDLLTTTKQTFEMNSRLKYVKNPEMITINVNMEPVIKAINTNFKALHKKVLVNKDKVTTILSSAYDKAREEYENYKAELPKTITIPAYKVPVMNIEMSSFTIPVPDVTAITVPTLYVPSALSKMTIPKITLPAFQKIRIPGLGDLTYEFTMKTGVATIQTDFTILNQESLKLNLDASSTSDFKFLTGKIEGHTNVDTVGEFKMASAVSLKHALLEGNHESDIILSFKTAETSITNSVKVHLPQSTKEIYQVITGNPAEGLVLSLSSPSAGHIAVQVQTKQPAQVKARVYGRYPTEPTTDIDIFGVKMSVMDSEKLNVQTTWNTEIPLEIMLELKKHVPKITEVVTNAPTFANRKTNRLIRYIRASFEKARRQGKAMFSDAIDYLAKVNPSDVMIKLSDNTIWILNDYQMKFEHLLSTVVKFLSETKFQIPGYEQSLSGLEVYQKYSAFIVDVTEEAIEKIPGYFVTMFSVVIDKFQAIELTLPGSNYIVRGKDIYDDLMIAMQKIQEQVIVTVRKFGQIPLDDIFRKIAAIQRFAIEQSEKLLQSLRSQDVGKLSIFLTDVYNDAINSRILEEVVEQVEEIHRVIVEYLNTVAEKIQDIVADMSIEQLRADIISWIDSSVKRINTFHNNVIRSLKEKTEDIGPYVRVGDRKIDVDIPLPFVVKFN